MDFSSLLNRPFWPARSWWRNGALRSVTRITLRQATRSNSRKDLNKWNGRCASEAGEGPNGKPSPGLARKALTRLGPRRGLATLSRQRGRGEGKRSFLDPTNLHDVRQPTLR